MINCLNCGKETKNKKYCCLSCRAIHRHKIGELARTLPMKNIDCKNCGKAIEVKINSNQEFCCKGCATGYINKSIHRHPWNYKLTKETDERIVVMAETRRTNHKGYKKLPRKSIYCKNCGVERVVSITSDHQFCSHKCVTENSWKTTREKRLRWIVEEPKKKKEHDRKVGVAQKGVPEKDWVKEQISQMMREQWKDPMYAQKHLNIEVPNKSEIKFDLFLQENYLDEWAFVGDGKIVIEGKIPDWININGKKLIIEYYGNYWHIPSDEEERINFFAKYGYKTLVIWESDFEAIHELT